MWTTTPHEIAFLSELFAVNGSAWPLKDVKEFYQTHVTTI